MRIHCPSLVRIQNYQKKEEVEEYIKAFARLCTDAANDILSSSRSEYKRLALPAFLGGALAAWSIYTKNQVSLVFAVIAVIFGLIGLITKVKSDMEEKAMLIQYASFYKNWRDQKEIADPYPPETFVYAIRHLADDKRDALIESYLQVCGALALMDTAQYQYAINFAYDKENENVYMLAIAEDRFREVACHAYLVREDRPDCQLSVMNNFGILRIPQDFPEELPTEIPRYPEVNVIGETEEDIRWIESFNPEDKAQAKMLMQKICSSVEEENKNESVNNR